MIGLLLLLQVRAFAPLTDAPYLAGVADSFKVPRDVVYGVAWKESRTGSHWQTLGPGIIDSTWRGDELVIRRVCREVGRFQANPCIDWVKRLHDPVCTYANMRLVYAISVHCGVENLAYLNLRYHGDWVIVTQRQNGGGQRAQDYVEDAFAYAEWLRLKHPEVYR